MDLYLARIVTESLGVVWKLVGVITVGTAYEMASGVDTFGVEGVLAFL